MNKIMTLFQKTLSLATAVVAGERVSDERIAKRIAICQACPLHVTRKKQTPEGEVEVLACGICGCKLKGDKSLTNLALYEETDRYGCKHKQGSQWKKNNV